MKASDTHEVEVILHLRVPKSTPQRHLDRLSMALVTVAADMDGVIEAGVGTPTPLKEPESLVSFTPCITGKVEVDGAVSEFMLPLENDSVGFSQWGAPHEVLWGRVELLDNLSGQAREWWADNKPVGDDDA